MIAANLHAGIPNPRFEQLATGAPVSWTFRGQVLPHTRRLSVLVEILESARGFARAAASLWADDKKIYAVPSLASRIVPGPPAGSPKPASGAQEEILDADRDSWLNDHCPTYVAPALPMMSVADRLASAVARADRGLKVIGMRDIRLRRWIAFASGPRRLKSDVKQLVSVPLESDSQRVAWRRPAPRCRDSMKQPPGKSSWRIIIPPALSRSTRWRRSPLRATLMKRANCSTGLPSGSCGPCAVPQKERRFYWMPEPGPCPRGLLLPGLAGWQMTHGIPNDSLHLWSDRIPPDMVGYPEASAFTASLCSGTPPLAGMVFDAECTFCRI